jgi:hypothetical protein
MSANSVEIDEDNPKASLFTAAVWFFCNEGPTPEACAALVLTVCEAMAYVQGLDPEQPLAVVRGRRAYLGGPDGLGVGRVALGPPPDHRLAPSKVSCRRPANPQKSAGNGPLLQIHIKMMV